MAKDKSKTELALKDLGFDKLFHILTYKYGLEVSGLFSYLYGQQVYFEESKTIGKGGYFFKKPEEMAGWCGETPSKIKKLLAILKKEGLILSRDNKTKGNNTKEYKVSVDRFFEIYHSYEIKTEVPNKIKGYLDRRDNREKRYQEKLKHLKNEEYLAFIEHQEYVFNQENEKL